MWSRPGSPGCLSWAGTRTSGWKASPCARRRGKHLKETGSGTILLAQYDSLGRYRGLMWLTLDEMPQGMTLRVILPVDNSGGEIANLKVFVVEDLTSSLPVGTPVSFGQV